MIQTMATFYGSLAYAVMSKGEWPYELEGSLWDLSQAVDAADANYAGCQ
jgi:hypothetical protein